MIPLQQALREVFGELAVERDSLGLPQQLAEAFVRFFRDYADRLIYGRTREFRQWRLQLKTLTEGIRLL